MSDNALDFLQGWSFLFDVVLSDNMIVRQAYESLDGSGLAWSRENS